MKAADLRAIAEAMTPGPWTKDKPGVDANGWATSMIVAATSRGQAAYAHTDRGTFPAADLAGIVALRNHVEALIALQEAVRVWRDTECETESDETDDYVIAAETDECAGDTHAIKCPVAVAVQAMIDALDRLEAIP